MGLSSSAPVPAAGDCCTAQRKAVQHCKKTLYDLAANECYPKDYKGECDTLELELKKCLSFSLCNSRNDATVFYDMSSAKKDRVTANKNLQDCLNKNKALRSCIPTHSTT